MKNVCNDKKLFWTWWPIILLLQLSVDFYYWSAISKKSLVESEVGIQRSLNWSVYKMIRDILLSHGWIKLFQTPFRNERGKWTYANLFLKRQNSCRRFTCLFTYLDLRWYRWYRFKRICWESIEVKGCQQSVLFLNTIFNKPFLFT